MAGECVMMTVQFELSDEEAEQLSQAAARRNIMLSELAQRWIRERLVHERERAEGGGRPMSPRAQRERRDQEPQ
jgi:hypothetical protein